MARLKISPVDEIPEKARELRGSNTLAMPDTYSGLTPPIVLIEIKSFLSFRRTETADGRATAPPADDRRVAARAGRPRQPVDRRPAAGRCRTAARSAPRRAARRGRPPGSTAYRRRPGCGSRR